MSNEKKHLMTERYNEVRPVFLSNPTKNDLITSVKNLDGENISKIRISINDRFLWLLRTSEGRIHVNFTDGKSFGAILIDMTEDKDALTTVFESNMGERTDGINSKYETVPEEEAVRVATHYLKTGYLPTASEGYEWQGNVEAFIKD